MLSIVIVSYNTSDLTCNCLSSIVEQTKEISYEIILVDNNSVDGTVDRVKSEFPEVSIIRNNDNRGFAYALNIGINAAKGDVILSINSDTIIIDYAITKSYRYLEENPDISILGIKLLNGDGSLQPSCRFLPDIPNCFCEAFFLTNIFPKSRFFGKYYMSYFDHNASIEVEWIKGTFMMIRKEVFDKIGLFDDNYFLYSEETDFMLRANRAGIKTFFYHEASIYHLEGASSGRNPEKVYERVHKTKIYFFRKNFKFPRREVLILIQYSAMINRVAAYFLYGILRLKPEYIKKSFHFLKALF